ncbi:ABC transporter permease [Gordonibacter massiliensis (ex Traore et al. 2017)]|uniref:ABC transporter permease n=1 Tax=Gordonibacter massiliensis (ex Traore et al. 2017) TaxID=1841863 RepID=A0A842JGE3_9ACTN|nr:ABC transporter permease [Gordonibacter massiliensis (ex Traore et al. 2017)]MBC2890727.1 ABC transporter permease [Gordonibacter massiliensis (ex Traore et al. 2017)]
MGLGKRALLYLTRKRGKTLILFLLLLVIATMALSGLAIKQAAQTAQLNVREALGGSFALKQNTGDSSKWESVQQGTSGSKGFYRGEPITKELADRIMGSVDGIKGYNASYQSTLLMKNKGAYLDLIDSDSNDGGMGAMLANSGDMGKTSTAFGATDTAYDNYFAQGFLKLVEGRHLEHGETGKALISKELAEKNGLKVGNTITLQQADFKAKMNGVDSEDTVIDVEIVGLYESTAKASAVMSNWSIDNAVFTSLEVIQHVRPETGGESYERVDFYVDDPAEVERIVNDVKNLDGLDPSDFTVDVDTSSVDSVIEPLENMDSLMTGLIAVMVVIGAVILYLVLAGRVRERIHESGVLLSLGVGKRAIVAQYLVEIALVAALAFGASYFTSGLVAQTAAAQLLDYATEQAGGAGNAGATGPTGGDGVMAADSSSMAPKFEQNRDMTKIEVVIDPAALVAVYFAGGVLIVGSVVAAALPVLRLKPKEILTKMS